MNGIRPPIEQAINKWVATQQLPEEDRPSQREVALEFDVPHTTLSNRLRGASKPRTQAYTHRQACTPGEEAIVVEYIRQMTATGHPPPPHHVYSFANLLRDNRIRLENPTPTKTSPLGINWIQKFKARHKELLETVWTRHLDHNRLQAVNNEDLKRWFNAYDATCKEFDIPPFLRFNMDETGYNMGGETPSTQVMVALDTDMGQKKQRKKKALKTGRGRQEWVTTFETTSATGGLLKPLIIYAGKNLYGHMLPKVTATEDFVFSTSDTGWSNNFLYLQWLTLVFHPQTAHLVTNKHPTRLLIVDGHTSHIEAEPMLFCRQNNIQLLCLPPHTSHVTQPLDVGVFGPLKSFMGRLTDNRAAYESDRISKYEFACRLGRARKDGITEKNIRSGWMSGTYIDNYL
jgi:hypothetical protein